MIDPLKNGRYYLIKKREIYEDEDSKSRQEKRIGSYPSENDRILCSSYIMVWRVMASFILWWLSMIYESFYHIDNHKYNVL